MEPRITSAEDYVVKTEARTLLGRLLLLGGDLSIPWVTFQNVTCKCLSIANLKNPTSLAALLKQGASPLTLFLRGQLSPATRQELRKPTATGAISERAQTQLVEDLNRILRGECIHNTQRFAGVQLERQTYLLLKDRPQGEDLMRLNRMLLEDAFPFEFTADRSLEPPQWKRYDVWSGPAILVTPTAEVKKAILEDVAKGISLEDALDRRLHVLDYLLAVDF